MVNKDHLTDIDFNEKYQTLLNNARLPLFGKIPGTVIATLSDPNIPKDKILGPDGKIVPAKLALYNLQDELAAVNYVLNKELPQEIKDIEDTKKEDAKGIVELNKQIEEKNKVDQIDCAEKDLWIRCDT